MAAIKAWRMHAPCGVEMRQSLPGQGRIVDIPVLATTIVAAGISIINNNQSLLYLETVILILSMLEKIFRCVSQIE